MNAPNFNFDAEGQSKQRSLAVSNRSGSIINTSPEAYVNFSANEFSEQPAANYRKYFFLFLTLALKYRWLILAICGLALAVGFIQTFLATPIWRATATIQIGGRAPKLVKEVMQDRDFGGGDARF